MRRGGSEKSAKKKGEREKGRRKRFKCREEEPKRNMLERKGKEESRN